MNELTTTTTADVIESVVITGDLAALAPDQRVAYYNRVCQSLGLNPLTKPFDYIKLNGKLTLYAKRDATDQLRRQYGVSVAIVNRERADGVFSVTAHATLPDGRTDESIGAVPIVYPDTIQEWQGNQRINRPHPRAGQQLTGEDLANAYMKAETKAKRRVTLSIVGLGWLDETEVGSITDAQPTTVNQTTGEIVRQVQAPKPSAPAAQPEPAISQTTFPEPEPPVGPMTPDQLRPWLRESANRFSNDAPLPEGWRKAITGHLSRLTGGDAGRHTFLAWAFGVQSSNALTEGAWHALYSWLDIRKADDGKFYPSDLAIAEVKLAMAALAEAQKPLRGVDWNSVPEVISPSELAASFRDN